MEIDFWVERWNNNETGFHQDQVNPYLAFFYGDKGPPADKRSSLKVFVPLCGKSKDMLWLSQNAYPVFAVECSDKAVRAFFEENALGYRHAENDDGALYQLAVTDAGSALAPLEIFQGDYFSLQPENLQDITDVFDRASLIALPESMRQPYAEKMAQLVKSGTRMLLVTLSYNQDEMKGPPFSVSEDEVHQLFDESFTVEKLCIKECIDDEPRFKQRGLSSLIETVYKLVRK